MEAKKILIVDDDEVLLKMASHDLGAAGYSVVTTKDSRQVIDLASTLKVDLILLDINMPHIDGGEVKHLLKEHPQTKDIPIIYLTGLLKKEEETSLGYSRGGNTFVAKPYNRDDLLNLIRRTLLGS